MVLLASVLLLFLRLPALAGQPPSTADAGPASAVRTQTAPRDTLPEGAGTPGHGETDASAHRPVARSVRTASVTTAGHPAEDPRHTTDGTFADELAAHRPGPAGAPPAGDPPRPAPGGTARAAVVLQTFRC
ncbi:hypothetical protein GCM10009601_08190 [Streptomyces thermospinosisporus]|uniref:Secreted protein n=1 Tax=Streptomyces thermospinosisporus TaxID=161482 RepID=A0ABP4JDR1_9ACTN